MSDIIKQIEDDANVVINEILDKANLKPGSLFIVGCSSSETIGEHLGTASSKEAAEAIYRVLSRELGDRGVNMAVQCCEHLNRAVVIEAEVAEKYGFEEVNVVPQPHAGGAFAVEAYKNFKNPIVVENVKAMADGGMDIDGVMIGMHIHNVVVPLRLEN
nr:TIGR01440 family protein [Lachnospiraceae bacterium]